MSPSAPDPTAPLVVVRLLEITVFVVLFVVVVVVVDEPLLFVTVVVHVVVPLPLSTQLLVFCCDVGAGGVEDDPDAKHL